MLSMERHIFGLSFMLKIRLYSCNMGCMPISSFPIGEMDQETREAIVSTHGTIDNSRSPRLRYFFANRVH
jgi:hypothetical protein